MGKTENRNRVRRRDLEHAMPMTQRRLMQAEIDKASKALQAALRKIRQDTEMRVDLLQRQRRHDENQAREAFARARAEIHDRYAAHG